MSTAKAAWTGHPPNVGVQTTGIVSAERELYQAVWETVDAYGAHSPGETYLPMFLDMATPIGGTVLDAGTGSGKGAVALAGAGFDVTCCDLTDAGLVPQARAFPFVEAVLWHDLRGVIGRRFAYVYCCDVLEHIPTALTMLTVSRLLEIAEAGVFLSIGLTPDSFGAFVGKSLHQTVQPYKWWRDHLREVGRIVESRDLINAGVFYLEPK